MYILGTRMKWHEAMAYTTAVTDDMDMRELTDAEHKAHHAYITGEKRAIAAKHAIERLQAVASVTVGWCYMSNAERIRHICETHDPAFDPVPITDAWIRATLSDMNAANDMRMAWLDSLPATHATPAP